MLRIFTNTRENNIRKTFRFPVIIGGLLLVVLAVVFFSATGGDDSNITWYSAFSLSEYGEFQDYGGERVEQSSSLLQVILIASLRKLTGFSVAALGIFISLLFAVLCIHAAVKLTRRISIEKNASLWTALFIATCYPILYWSVSGLDATLSAFSLTILIISCGDFVLNRKKIGLSILFIIFYLTARPEGFFIFAATLAIIWLLVPIFFIENKNDFRKRILYLFVSAIIVFAALCLFRILYFQRLFPEPVYIKAAGLSMYKIKLGIKYIFRNLSVPSQSIWFLLFAAGVIFMLKRKTVESEKRTESVYAILSGSAVLSVFIFLILTGADWMENGRYLVPILPCVLAFASIFLVTRKKWQNVFATMLLSINLITLLFICAWNSRGRPIWVTGKIELTESQKSEFQMLQYWCKDGERDIPVAMYLDTLFTRVAPLKKEKIVIMSGQAGTIISYLAQKHPHSFDWIDIWGLSDRTVSSCPPTRAVQTISIPSWDYDAYFKLIPEIRKQCPDFKEPDIIFELDDICPPPLLIKNGYIIVYTRTGTLDSGDALFPGIVFNQGQLIAVNESLLDVQGLP